MCFRQDVLRALAFALLVLAASGCGDDTAAPGPAPTRDPDEALARVRAAADADDEEAVRERLREWPRDDASYREHPATRVALTWIIRLALQAGDADEARDAFRLLDERFAGIGATPEGRSVPRSAMLGGLVDGILRSARERAEGDDADPAAAARLVAAATALAEHGSEEDRARATAARRWVVELETVGDLGVSLHEHAGPRVVVFADDFVLGEAVFPSVLKRWQRETGRYGLRVSVVPVLRGSVRAVQSLRRIPEPNRREERLSIVSRALPLGVHIEDGSVTGATLSRRLGISEGSCALLVCDREGRIVGRLSGPILDPRALEAAVQRVSTR